MKIAVTTDQIYPVHQFVLDWLKEKGHEPILFGALNTEQDDSWVKASADAAKALLDGTCDEGIFLCWTGTGISIAANKFSGIRCALCTDAPTAHAARIWNHANVLALSNRLLSQDLANEILTAWFTPYDKVIGALGVNQLTDLERKQCTVRLD